MLVAVQQFADSGTSLLAGPTVMHIASLLGLFISLLFCRFSWLISNHFNLGFSKCWQNLKIILTICNNGV